MAMKREHIGIYLSKPYTHGIQQVVGRRSNTPEVNQMAKKEEEEKKTYKQPVLFLRKSKTGKHLYAFNRESELEVVDMTQKGMVLGGEVGSLIMDVSEVERLIAGTTEWIKIGVIPKGTVEE
jgi:hypothetical protein